MKKGKAKIKFSTYYPKESEPCAICLVRFRRGIKVYWEDIDDNVMYCRRCIHKLNRLLWKLR